MRCWAWGSPLAALVIFGMDLLRHERLSAGMFLGGAIVMMARNLVDILRGT